MLKLKNILLLSLSILSLASCATEQTKISQSSLSNQASYGAMTGYAKALKSKDLLKAGIRPINYEQLTIYSQEITNRTVQDLESSDFVINKVGQDLVLIIPKHIILSSDSSINQQQSISLNKLVKILKDYPSTLIEITGHTDSKGSADLNQKLSIIRAETLTKYLINRGIIAEKFFINGMGETRWIANNNTAEGRATNSRLEIRISPAVYIK